MGTVLTRRLLALGCEVCVLDTFWFGDSLPSHERLTKIRGDIRDGAIVDRALEGADVGQIHSHASPTIRPPTSTPA